jgi:hypothetical protein
MGRRILLHPKRSVYGWSILRKKDDLFAVVRRVNARVIEAMDRGIDPALDLSAASSRIGRLSAALCANRIVDP